MFILYDYGAREQGDGEILVNKRMRHYTLMVLKYIDCLFMADI
jgi:hypothetical protein